QAPRPASRGAFLFVMCAGPNHPLYVEHHLTVRGFVSRIAGGGAMTSLKVNGEPRAVEADPAKPLLWVLREDLGLTGTKFGCGIGACGACTVHVDGAPVRSCSLPLGAAADADIVTIEGLPASAGLGAGELHPVQRAWIDAQVPQCGYCQSG